LEDKKGDTLIYSKLLEADVPLWSMIRGNGVGVEDLEWEGVRANIIRKDSIEGYNFQFLVDVFAGNSQNNTVSNSNTKPLDITIGTLDLQDFDVVYRDDVIGIDSRYVVGDLQLDMTQSDFNKQIFKASHLAIENTTVEIDQSIVPETSSAQDSVALPYMFADELQLNNVYVAYNSEIEDINTSFDMNTAYAENVEVNLNNNEYNSAILQFSNSSIFIHTEVSQQLAQQSATSGSFVWPSVLFSVDQFDLTNNIFEYRVADARLKRSVFDPNAVRLNDLNLKGSDLYFKDIDAGANITESSMKEYTGLNVRNLSTQASIDNRSLDINNLNLVVNDTRINGAVDLQYASLNKFISAPEQSKMDLRIPSFQTDLDEVFTFQPSLAENVYLKTLSEKRISGNITAFGFLSEINLQKANVNWGPETKISARGIISNPTNIDSLRIDLPQFSVVTQKSDVLQFVDEQQFGVSLPQEISLSGTLEGTSHDLYTDAKLTTSQGIVTAKGSFSSSDPLAFDSTLKVKDYQIGELLNNEQYGTLNLTVDAKGKGTTLNTLNAEIDATVNSFQLNQYNIDSLNIEGNIQNGKGRITSVYKDENLNADLVANVVLDSVNPEADFKLNVIGADLQALGLMKRDVRTGMVITANFKGNTTTYNVSGQIDDGVVVYDNRAYLLGSIDTKARVRKDSTSLSISNKIVDLDLQSNTDPQTFATAIERHISSYFYRDVVLPDTLKNPVILNMQGTISDAPLLREVFLVNLKDLDTIDLAVDFDETQRKLKANITAPHIHYGGSELDSLAFTMDTDRENFTFDLGFENIQSGPFDIQRTHISGNQINNELDLSFIAYHQDSTLIQIKSQITGNRDSLRFHVIPEDLIVQKHKWNTPENNEAILTRTNNDIRLNFNNFNFTRRSQSVVFKDDIPSISEDHAGVYFQNFKLSEFLNYLNPDEQYAKGRVNGDFILVEPFHATGIIADLSIEELELLDVNMGTMTVDAKSLGGNNYDFNSSIKGGEVDLDLTGDYRVTEEQAFLNLDLALNKVNMKALEGFSLGEVTNTDGSFAGNFKVNGTLAEPKYEGSVTFSDADLTVKKLNAPFTLQNETLRVDNSGLQMDNFTIRDTKGNTFIASGKIGTESFVNPTFNLSVKADNFQLLDAKEDDNDFVYGKATINAQATIKGDLEIPIIDAEASINDNTDISYILPSSTVNVESRDGIVTFVNRENPDAILTRTEEQTATVTGFDVKARLSVGKEAKLKVIIDQNTGDHFQVYGDGNFVYTMKPNGRISFSGLYTAEGGHYEMNMYNLVNRKFKLVKGSQISWSGDPFDAKLNIKALYEVETSASSLMTPLTSGSDATVKNSFSRSLPFQVYLNIDGELTSPIIDFSLDMPEDEQGAVGGQVYGRIQQLNSQEAELNKQVFSLLVLNRFYPEPGSDGSRGGFVNIARDNLNDALSDQLNMFSNKLLGDTGVELDFGLDSYTDYRGTMAEQRTQLDIAAQKKLFDDRLIVRVGSAVDLQGTGTNNETAPLVGNVSLEYLLTENGRYRLRGFRRNEFENVIDGQTIVSGIALIFTQEFNQFSDLWDALFTSQSKKEKEVKIEKEKKEKSSKENEVPENKKQTKNRK
jgi:hypothetical protein